MLVIIGELLANSITKNEPTMNAIHSIEYIHIPRFTDLDISINNISLLNVSAISDSVKMDL